MARALALAGWFFLSAVAAAQPAEELDAGALRLSVHVSRTAQLFHIVDQISEWDVFTHRQYLRYFRELSDEDRRQLKRHAELRRRKGWGGGLEQTLYSPLDLNSALEKGVRAGHLTAEEAAVEREVLSHFSTRVDPFIQGERGHLDAFRAELFRRRAELERVSAVLSKLTRTKELPVPVFLIANPSEGEIGGGANGGILVLEVARGRDSLPTIAHELTHLFLAAHRPLLQRAAEAAPGLDAQTLNEGIAYSLTSVLFPSDGARLVWQVAGDFGARKDLSDPYVRFNRFALAIQPRLKAAVDDGSTLEGVLPKLVEVWPIVVALSQSAPPLVVPEAQQPVPGQPPRSFAAGPGWKALAARLSGDLTSCNHGKQCYDQLLSKARAGEMLILTFSLDRPDERPVEGYEDLLPMPWPEIAAALEAGKKVEKTGRARGVRTVLFAAPTKRDLEQLIQQTKLIDQGP